MTSYLFKRLLLMIPTLFGILVVSFLVIRLAPGDPASQKFGGVGQASGGINAERGTEAAESDSANGSVSTSHFTYSSGCFSGDSPRQT